MRFGERGFTLIELMIVTVVIGILVAIGLANYANMQNQARVGQVKSNMHIVQLAAEDFATRNSGTYPPNAAAVALEGGMTLVALLPGGGMPINPFTTVATTLDWTNAAGSAPVTDPAGGISLNVTQALPGAAWDQYEIIGTNATNAPLSLVLTNN
jgi:prepilin-type N-terminal cleavage/methylation domain-containing protein